MRRAVRTPVLALLLLAWLAYGPGAVGLQATAACHHAEHHHAAGGAHHRVPPPQTCFCDAMTGHGTPAPSPTACPDLPALAITLPAERRAPPGEPLHTPSRAPRAPETPPPIAA